MMGRVCVDLYPMQLRMPLEDVEGFHKYVGGFAANVATGLARLGVRVAIVSAVGDDGHGRFVRGSSRRRESTAAGWACTRRCAPRSPSARRGRPTASRSRSTARPRAPTGSSRRASLDLDAIAAAPLVYVSGTGFALEPSRLATMAVLEAAGRRRRHHRARPRLAGDAVGRPGRLRRRSARRAHAHGRRRARLRRGDRRGGGRERRPAGCCDLGAARRRQKHGARRCDGARARRQPASGRRRTRSRS